MEYPDHLNTKDPRSPYYEEPPELIDDGFGEVEGIYCDKCGGIKVKIRLGEIACNQCGGR